MKRKYGRQLICGLVLFFMVGFARPVTVAAETATVNFGSEEYEEEEQGRFQIGVYINGESRVGKYYVEVKYDNRRMEYVDGGTSEEDGVIILEGTGVRSQVKYMLTFRPLSGGTANISIQNAEVYTAGENAEGFEITTLGSAPVYIEGEDTVGVDEEEEDPGEETEFSTSIPVIGKTTVEENEYYLVNLSEYIPDEADWQYECNIGFYEETSLTYLTDANRTISYLYLMDEAEQLYLYAYSSDKERLYPVNTLLSDGEKYYFMSPYVCNVWPEELTLDIIQSQSIVYAMKLDGTSGFYKVSGGNKLVPWDSSEGEASLYEQMMKLVAILAVTIAIIMFVILLYAHMERSKRGVKKHRSSKLVRGQEKTKAKTVFDGFLEEELGVEDFSLDVTEDEIRAWHEEVQEERKKELLEQQLKEEEQQNGPAVISVQDVSMVFKIATSNVSGIKEYVIQLLKKQISYRELRALNHINFNVYKGEVVGIIGTNGSGKSTLLRIVSGALKPSSGKVVVDHKKVQLLTLGTGFDMELTAKENVYLNGAIIGYTKEFIDEKYDEIVAFAELEGFMEEKVKNFSSGMVSRLGFAIATVGDAAEILILDEVLSVGDEFFRKKSLKRVKEMIHGGSTVLMVSHSLGTILENCSKVVWIEKGVLKMVGEPKVVCEAYRKMNERG